MKIVSNLLALLVFASLAVIVSCKDDDDPPEKTERQTRAEELQGRWTTTQDNVRFNGNAVDAANDWSGFVLNITGDENGGSYTASGVPSGYEIVWPTSSATWEFMGSSGVATLERGDGAILTISSVSETSLVFDFEIEDPAGRIAGVGMWKFTLAAASN